MSTLRVCSNNFYFTFSYKVGNGEYVELMANLDGSFLSDEACFEGWFTGSMIAMCTQDLTGRGLYSDIFAFKYENLKNAYIHQKKALL